MPFSSGGGGPPQSGTPNRFSRPEGVQRDYCRSQCALGKVGRSSGERRLFRSSGANDANLLVCGAPWTEGYKMASRNTKQVTVEVKVDVAATVRWLVLLAGYLLT